MGDGERSRREVLRTGVSVVAVVGLAGCGGGQSGDGTGTEEADGDTPADGTDTTAEPTETPTGTESPTPTIEPGELVWEFDAGVTGSRPAVLDDGVFVGSFEGSIHGVETDSGTERWAVSTDRQPNRDVATGSDAVFALTNGGVLRALEPDDGTERWQWEVPDEAQSGSSSSGPLYSMGSPVASGDTVVMAAEDLVALAAADGTERWRHKPGEGVSSTPAMADGSVFVFHSAGLSAYAIDDGSRLWGVEDPGIATFPATGPVAGDGVVVLAGGEDIVAFDAASGDELWAVQRGEDTDFEQLAVGPERVYAVDAPFGGSPTLVALDAADGTDRWTYGEGFEDAEYPPVVADGTVYVGTESFGTNLVALDAADGTDRWTFTHDATQGSSPRVAGSALYLGTDDSLVKVRV